MNEYAKYLLSLLEISEWCTPIHEAVVWGIAAKFSPVN